MNQEELIEMVRRAGVRRGINAAIETLDKLRDTHNRRSSGYNDLTIAILKLQQLTIKEAEEI